MPEACALLLLRGGAVIVLSAGMPRAGSGWHYNLIHDLMQTTGCADTADIRDRFGLQRILTEVNFNIGVLSLRRLVMVAVPALLGYTFVIKAHSRPTLAFRVLRSVNLIRATYIYRDPRDAMLSAMDYGNRGVQKGQPNAFSDVADFDRALDFILKYIRIWEAWTRERKALLCRYEDLLLDYDGEALRLVEFLRLDREKADVNAVVERYRPAQAEGRQGTHFYKGRIGRFREAFSEEQQLVLAERLGKQLIGMGYSV